MNASTLIRWAGLSAMGSGFLFIGMQLIHPSDVLSSVGTSRWIIVHCIGVAMGLLGMFGIAGIYTRQAKETGWLGFAGWLLMSLFFAVTAAFQFIEAFVTPKLVDSAPDYVEGFLAMAAGKSSEADLGFLPEIYAVTGGLYVAGGLALGIATFRARVLPRIAGGLLALATVLPIVGGSVPHPWDRAFAVPMGLAIAWLGYALWVGRRELAPIHVPNSESIRPGSAVVE